MFKRSVSDQRRLRAGLTMITATAIAFTIGHWRNTSMSSAGYRPDFGARHARAKQPSALTAGAGQNGGQVFTKTVEAEFSSGPIYDKLPELTAEQKAVVARASAQSDLVAPVREGDAARPIPPPPEPATEPAIVGAGDDSLGATGDAAGSSNFKYLTVSDLPTSATPSRSIRTSPSVAAGYGMVFMTGNWFAALSTDFGSSWKY